MKRYLLPLLLMPLIATSKDSAPMLPPLLPTDGLATFQTFGGIPVSEFLRITLGDLTGYSYIISPEVLAMNMQLSADLTSQKSKIKDNVKFLRQVFDPLGIEIREIEPKVYYILKKPEQDKEQQKIAAKEADTQIYVYSPKNREVGSLSSYFSLFPKLRFSFSAGISTPAMAPVGATEGGGSVMSNSTGSTTFSATDKNPSFLVIRGEQQEIDLFKKFIEQIDIKVPQVQLRLFVFEVRNTDGKETALNVVLNLLGGKLSLGQTIDNPTLKFSISNFDVAFSNLATDSRVSILTAPFLTGTSGQTATARVAAQTPTLSGTTTTNVGVQQNVQYQDGGVILSMTPTVLEESIKLNVSQEISSFVKTDTGVSGSPTKLVRSFVSDLVMQSGEIAVLGGLSQEQQSDATSKSLFFFGSKSKQNTKSELVVLLKVDKL